MDQINYFLNDSKEENKKKRLKAKINSKKYTLFNHFKKINQLLRLN